MSDVRAARYRSQVRRQEAVGLWIDLLRQLLHALPSALPPSVALPPPSLRSYPLHPCSCKCRSKPAAICRGLIRGAIRHWFDAAVCKDGVWRTGGPPKQVTDNRKIAKTGWPRRQALRQLRFDGHRWRYAPQPCFRTAVSVSHLRRSLSSLHRPIGPMDSSARLSHCAGCHCQGLVCGSRQRVLRRRLRATGPQGICAMRWISLPLQPPGSPEQRRTSGPLPCTSKTKSTKSRRFRRGIRVPLRW